MKKSKLHSRSRKNISAHFGKNVCYLGWIGGSCLKKIDTIPEIMEETEEAVSVGVSSNQSYLHLYRNHPYFEEIISIMGESIRLNKWITVMFDLATNNVVDIKAHKKFATV